MSRKKSFARFRKSILRTISATICLTAGVSSFALADLVAFYSFDNATNPLENTSGEAPGLIELAEVAPSWEASSGFNGSGCYTFSNQRLMALIDVSPDKMPQMTWGAWVNTQSLSRTKVLGHDNNGWDRTIGLDERLTATTNGTMRYTTYTGSDPINGTNTTSDTDNGPLESTASTDLSPDTIGTWVFIAASYDQATKTINFYLDKDATSTSDALLSVTESGAFDSGHPTFAIGSTRPNSNSSPWSGLIDNVFVYNEALTPAQITAIRDSGTVLPPKINSFIATPGNNTPGQPVTFSWSTENTTSVSINMGAPAISGNSGSIQLSPGPNNTTTYTLTASNAISTVTAQAIVAINATPLPPTITEFVASNGGSLKDGDGNSPDWIEIHNPNPYAISLLGYSLRDSSRTWPFPNVQIPGNGYLVVFASNQATTTYTDAGGNLHTNFALSVGGEVLQLLNPNSTIAQQFTGVPAQSSDIAWGLDGTSSAIGFLTTPTPRAANGTIVAGIVADTAFSVNRGFFQDPFAVNITSITPGASITYTTNGTEPTSTNGTIVPPPSPTTAPTATVNISTTTTLRARAFRNGWASTNVDTNTYIFPAHVVNQPAAPAGFPSTWGNYLGLSLFSFRTNPIPADYAMNASVVDETTTSRTETINGLKSLPTISIVGNPDDIFGVNGILPNPLAEVDGTGVYTEPFFESEKPCSMEWIEPNGNQPGGPPQIQVDMGLSLSGGFSRHYEATPKKSLALNFRSKYGASKLQFPVFGQNGTTQFDRINLRAGFSDAWVDDGVGRDGSVGRGNPANGNVQPQYIRDLFARDTMAAMGQPSSRGTFVHLYINGLYWGIYNPTERPDHRHAANTYGGQPEDYLAVKHAGLYAPGVPRTNSVERISGNYDLWKNILNFAGDPANRFLADPPAYHTFRTAVDADSLIDYFMLNSFLSNTDWPGKNWYAFGRQDSSDGGLKFIPWDSEYSTSGVTTNMNSRLTGSSNTSNTAARMFDQALANPDFRLRFADRLYKHAFNGGPLSSAGMMARYSQLAANLEPAINAEAARWGDNPNTYHGIKNYRKSSWINGRNAVLNNFIPNRLGNVISHYRTVGLYSSTGASPPQFTQHGGTSPTGNVTFISPPAESTGRIYYTTDGSDPRSSITSFYAGSDTAPVSVGNVSPTAITLPIGTSTISLSSSRTVKARFRRASTSATNPNEWSPLAEAFFIVNAVPASASNLVISKIHYHPASATQAEIAAGYLDDSFFEFVELTNYGNQAINLAGLKFVSGIDLIFPADTSVQLAAGERAAVVANSAAFISRYGNGPRIIGTFANATRLGNDGDTVALVNASNVDVCRVTYNDGGAWPNSPDGDGPSLVLAHPLNPPLGNDISMAQHWRPSIDRAGAPGAADQFPIAPWLASQPSNNPLDDPNNDGISQAIAFATGALAQPNAASYLPNIKTENLSVGGVTAPYHILSIRELIGANGTTHRVQSSTNMNAWSNDISSTLTLIRTRDLGDGTMTREYRVNQPAPSDKLFFRLSVTF